MAKKIRKHVFVQNELPHCLYCGCEPDDDAMGQPCVARPAPKLVKLIVIEIRTGEYEFTSYSLHDRRASGDKYARAFYAGRSYAEGNGWYSFFGGEVWARAISEKLITEAQAQVLRETGVAA